MRKFLTVLFILSVFFLKTWSSAWSKNIVVENFGKKIELTNNNRFVVLFPQSLPFVFMIDAQKALVGYPGMGLNAKPYFSGNLILEKMPNFKDKVADIGYPFGPSIEKIVALKPDFIVNVNMQADNEQFKNLKIPVIEFSGCFGSFNDLFESIKSLGEATGKISQANKLINYYKNTISYVQQLVKNVKYKPKVLYLSYQGPHGNKLTSGGQFNTLVNNIISIAGGISVSRNVKGKFGQISKEDIIKWNPDYIFLGINSPSAVEDIYKDKDLKFVNAVKNKKVYIVPEDSNATYSNWYAPEKAPLGLLWTAKILHPNATKSLNLIKEATYYYKTFWGIPLDKLKLTGDIH